jgi:hypothetical protein
MAQTVGGDLPYRNRSARRTQPQVERAVGKRRSRIPRKHKLRSCQVDPSGRKNPPSSKVLLNVLPLEERLT